MAVKLPRNVLTIAALLVVSRQCSGAPPSPSKLVTIGAPAVTAELVSVEESGEFQFQKSNGEVIAVSQDELVRWSNPASPRSPDELLLVDGSRFCLAAAWGDSPSLVIGASDAEMRTRDFGHVKIARSKLRGAFWQLPPDDAARQVVLDKLATDHRVPPGVDVLLLDNGDELTGRVDSIAQVANGPNQPADAVVAFTGSVGDIKLPVSRLRGIAFSPNQEAVAKSPGRAKLVIGLRDGTLVAASGMSGEADNLMIHGLSLGDLKAELKNVVYLQCYSDRVAYLSDLEDVSYRDEPYLDLHWPLRRDRNVLNNPLRVRGQTYAKALSMHSAARVTYALDGRFQRFAAAVALDDAAQGRGSVIFRVYLRKGGEWQEAYASPVVRGGDPPRAVDIELKQADQLALAVDYADRGDERDYANWLDARLERTSTELAP